MTESSINIVEDSPKTGLGIPVKTKNPLSRIKLLPTGPFFGFELGERLLPVLSQERLFWCSFARNSPLLPLSCLANRDAPPARRA